MLFLGQTDKGLKRENNQDYFSVFSLADNLVVAIVCDGMGGAKGGQTASLTAVKKIEEQIKKVDIRSFTPRNIKSILESSVYAANSNVFTLSCNDTSLNGMGTTVVVSVILDNNAYIVHAGDSRAYFYDSENIKLVQITKDHSIVQSLIESGQLTSDEAQHHPKRNVITRAVGVSEEIDVDYNEVELSNDDILLICSDGLTNYVDEDSITDILTHNNFDSIPASLIKNANENGGGDNITSVVVTDFSE